MTTHRYLQPARGILTSLALCCLHACTFTYVDQSGALHIVGMHALTLHPSDSPAIAGQVLDVQTLGVALRAGANGSSISLGYSRDLVGQLKNNVAVIGDPRALLDSHQTCIQSKDGKP